MGSKEIPWDASYETWRGTIETYSFNYLSEIYRKLPLKVAKDSPQDTDFNWTMFKSTMTDYDVDFSAFVATVAVGGKTYFDANPALDKMSRRQQLNSDIWLF